MNQGTFQVSAAILPEQDRAGPQATEDAELLDDGPDTRSAGWGFSSVP